MRAALSHYKKFNFFNFTGKVKSCFSKIVCAKSRCNRLSVRFFVLSVWIYTNVRSYYIIINVMIPEEIYRRYDDKGERDNDESRIKTYRIKGKTYSEP